MNKALKIVSIILAAAVFAVGSVGVTIMINKRSTLAQKEAELLTAVYQDPAASVPQATTIILPAQTTAAIPAATAPAVSTTAPTVTTPAPVPTAAPETQPQPQTTASAQSADVSGYSKAQVVDLLKNAVTKTKAYTGTVTVHHVEKFENVNILQITGGNIVKGIANSLIGSLVKPSDEMLTFNGGTSVTGEGETVQLTLPKNGPFTLTESGAASARAANSGGNIIVDVTLVSETATMTQKPAANSAAIGYLDISSLDISAVKLNAVNITYSGSTIHATINPDGYISAIAYTIPLHIEGEATVPVVGNANATFEGQEIETWEINW